MAIVVLSILSALAIPGYGKATAAARVAVVSADAHSIDHAAVAQSRISGSSTGLLASSINPMTHTTYLQDAINSLNMPGVYTAVVGMDTVSFTVTNTAWNIVVCLKTSAVSGQYGTVTQGACTGVGLSLAALAARADRDAVTAASAVSKVPSSLDPGHGLLTYLDVALAADGVGAGVTDAIGADGRSYTVTQTSSGNAVCLTTSSLTGMTGVVVTGACTGMQAPLVSVVTALDVTAVGTSSGAGGRDSSVDAATHKTYFQDAIAALTGGTALTATVGADGTSFTVADALNGVSVCLSTGTSGHTGTVATGACTEMQAPFTTLVGQLDAAAVAASAPGGKASASTDVATSRTYFMDALAALTGGSALTAALGADRLSYTVTDTLTGGVVCLTTAASGQAGTVVSGACVGYAAPGLTMAPLGVSTYAGNGTNANATNAVATSASLANPDAVALAPDGTMYVGEGSTATTTGAYQIMQISPAGVVSVLVGDGNAGWAVAGGAYNPSTVLALSAARVGRVQGLTYAAGKLYVAEGSPNSAGGAVAGLCNAKPTLASGMACGIRVINLAASTIQGFVGNGSQPAARYCTSPSTNTGCSGATVVPPVTKTYTNWDNLTIAAWTATKTPLTADLGPSYGIAVAPNGDVYFTQTPSGCLFHVTASTGTLVFDTCFPWANAQIIANQVAIDGAGVVYVATYQGVYQWKPTTSTLNHWGAYTTCAVATQNYCEPGGIQVNAAGTELWLGNSWGNTVDTIVINPTTFSASTMAILAGAPGVAGSTDAAPATAGRFSGLTGDLVLDETNNTVYLADMNNWKIRQMPAS